MSIFDLVTAANIAQYWIEKNVNELPLLGETLFPFQKEIGVKLEWIKGAKNQPVALRLSAYDSKSIRRDRKGFEKFANPIIKPSGISPGNNKIVPLYFDDPFFFIQSIISRKNNIFISAAGD